MTWPGLYWSKVHFNNRLWTPVSSMGDRLRCAPETICGSSIDRVGVGRGHIYLWGLPDERVLPAHTHTYAHGSRYKLIPIHFNWCSPRKQSRQQRDVTSNQWDSRSGLFISVSSNSRQWNPCQVPGCEVIKGTYRWMGCLRHRQTTSQYPRQCL